MILTNQMLDDRRWMTDNRKTVLEYQIATYSYGTDYDNRCSLEGLGIGFILTILRQTNNIKAEELFEAKWS